MVKLEGLLQVSFKLFYYLGSVLTSLQGNAEASQLINPVRDAHRFIRYHKWAIENTPLQVYTSALVFSPARSLVRELFKQEEPKWITTKPAMQDDWSSCLQTLEGHSGPVWSVAFSHDGKRTRIGIV
jgi:WD40 repeat protein